MHVLITGASSGIGEALVREYARRGAKLTLVARRRNLLEKLAAEVGGAHVIDADLTDSARAVACVDEAERQSGPLDVLINNAGVQIVAPASATPWADAEALLRVDLHTPLRLVQRVLPAMLQRRSGVIINIASMAGIAPTPGMLFYNAAKGGLGAASEGLASELRGTGVHVLTVYPGPVESAMEAAGRAAYEQTAALRSAPTGKPEVLARLVANAAQSGRRRVIYPWIYGLARLFPNLSRWFIDAFTPRLRHG